jgi:hypothetical protein
MTLAKALTAMRDGAVLHLTLADGPRWQLHDGVTVVTVSSTIVRAMMKRGRIKGAGDSLFDDVPSQIWRYSTPIGSEPCGVP